MARYARETTVNVASSKVELENIVTRYGADQYGYSTEAGMVQIGFRIGGLFVKLRVPMPLPTDRRFATTPTGRIASESARLAAWEQGCRQRWRALVLVTKAKLEAVECGISTIEREFLADTVLPDGRTVGEAVGPQIRDAYLTGAQPMLLSEGGS